MTDFRKVEAFGCAQTCSGCKSGVTSASWVSPELSQPRGLAPPTLAATSWKLSRGELASLRLKATSCGLAVRFTLGAPCFLGDNACFLRDCFHPTAMGLLIEDRQPQPIFTLRV